MSTSNTTRQSFAGLEYPVHIKQVLYLIAAVLRRIAAKRQSQQAPVRTRAHDGGA